METLGASPTEADLAALGELLADAVDSGAAVSFVAPLSVDEATAWWREHLGQAHPRGALLVARDDEGIAGCVELVPAWAPNQPQRGEVVKLIVHRRARGRGLGDTLMEGVEGAAREAGLTLLTLDAKRGEAAERLYRRRGWTHVGTIPDFAVDPDGVTPHDAVIFFKRLT